MKCSLLTLSCALDGELSRERQLELEAHLVTCERCKVGMRYLREETERVAQLAAVQLPSDKATALLERAHVLVTVASSAPSARTHTPERHEAGEAGIPPVAFTSFDLGSTAASVAAETAAEATPAIPEGNGAVEALAPSEAAAPEVAEISPSPETEGEDGIPPPEAAEPAMDSAQSLPDDEATEVGEASDAAPDQAPPELSSDQAAAAETAEDQASAWSSIPYPNPVEEASPPAEELASTADATDWASTPYPGPGDEPPKFAEAQPTEAEAGGEEAISAWTTTPYPTPLGETAEPRTDQAPPSDETAEEPTTAWASTPYPGPAEEAPPVVGEAAIEADAPDDLLAADSPNALAPDVPATDLGAAPPVSPGLVWTAAELASVPLPGFGTDTEAQDEPASDAAPPESAAEAAEPPVTDAVEAPEWESSPAMGAPVGPADDFTELVLPGDEPAVAQATEPAALGWDDQPEAAGEESGIVPELPAWTPIDAAGGWSGGLVADDEDAVSDQSEISEAPTLEQGSELEAEPADLAEVGASDDLWLAGSTTELEDTTPAASLEGGADQPSVEATSEPSLEEGSAEDAPAFEDSDSSSEEERPNSVVVPGWEPATELKMPWTDLPAATPAADTWTPELASTDVGATAGEVGASDAAAATIGGIGGAELAADLQQAPPPPTVPYAPATPPTPATAAVPGLQADKPTSRLGHDFGRRAPGGGGRKPVPDADGGGADQPRSWTRTGLIAVAALAVVLIGWNLTHGSQPASSHHPKVQSTPATSAKPSPSATAAPSATPSPVSLTGAQTIGGGGSGYQVQTVRYGVHGSQLWVVFQMLQGTGSPQVTTGFDGPTTLYVELEGVAPGTAVPQPAAGTMVSSITVGQVAGFNGAVYIIHLTRAAQVSPSLVPGTETGGPGERVLLILQ